MLPSRLLRKLIYPFQVLALSSLRLETILQLLLSLFFLRLLLLTLGYLPSTTLRLKSHRLLTIPRFTTNAKNITTTEEFTKVYSYATQLVPIINHKYRSEVDNIKTGKSHLYHLIRLYLIWDLSIHPQASIENQIDYWILVE